MYVCVFDVVMCDISFVNSVHVINQNPRVTAINSCIEVDLTGQVCADSIGTRMYSGLLSARTCIQFFLGMYRIAIFKIRPEPDSTGYQTNYPAGTGTGYLDTCCIMANFLFTVWYE